ncbi:MULTISPECIES: glycosyl hydrolase 108 family protein [Mesorhizobium]|uniref:glycosyl hydrolase 108 family protein n=1 Tax=Mesorhizobium TaxID=68287 RepID=UPI0024528A7C|nr:MULTISPECIES: glycosyl hydrolase 108 family protein [Mesorhizobium]
MLAREGGYSNHLDDPDGPTMKGLPSASMTEGEGPCHPFGEGHHHRQAYRHL